MFELKRRGYRPKDYYEQGPELMDAIDSIASGRFSGGNAELFRPIVESLLHHDEYLVMADYAAYVDCCEQAAEAYRDQDRWTRMSILNTARCGFFSSDRSMRQYCEDIWRVSAVEVE